MNEKQHSFVTEYLRIGDKMIAYKKAYNSDDTNYDSVLSAANRLMRNPEVAKAIEDVQSRIRAQVEYELKEEMRMELLTVQRKRELLAAIATGYISVEQSYKGKDCRTCTQLVKPTINQMLKAIDLDSKLAGHYARHKQTDTTQPVKPQNKPTEEEQKAVHIQNDIADTQKLEQITKEKLTQFLSPVVNNITPLSTCIHSRVSYEGLGANKQTTRLPILCLVEDEVSQSIHPSLPVERGRG